MTAKWQTRKLQALITQKKHQKNPAGTVWTNFLGTLENSQKLTATKQTLNQEKAIFKMVGEFCGIFSLLFPCPLPSATVVLLLKQWQHGSQLPPSTRG